MATETMTDKTDKGDDADNDSDVSCFSVPDRNVTGRRVEFGTGRRKTEREGKGCQLSAVSCFKGYLTNKNSVNNSRKFGTVYDSVGAETRGVNVRTIVSVPRVAELAREGGSNAHGGRVRQHKKGELLNIGATQEVPSSLGGDSKGREGGEAQRGVPWMRCGEAGEQEADHRSSLLQGKQHRVARRHVTVRGTRNLESSGSHGAAGDYCGRRRVAVGLQWKLKNDLFGSAD
ncbi:hypothetical protein E2C01_026781 [Portunus trituberculatus]|uniref:Uncharacterized protein n=1 Tax=Portunus trituberculatus TaxID=210409 RepID=A0A5B7EGF2_PORTR|nr:hypothetical protein [Portunus trituberculatus]